MENKPAAITVKNYGDMLAQINDMELVRFEEDGGYQGKYCAVLKNDVKLYYYIGSYGSCSGCDWLESEGHRIYVSGPDEFSVPYGMALEFCGGIKPEYIVPLDMPLKVENLGRNEGFKITKMV